MGKTIGSKAGNNTFGLDIFVEDYTDMVDFAAFSKS
jgi:hypothetical protein